MRKLALALLTILASAPARAGSYVQQGAFGVSAAAVAGMDRDAAGNLYVLGLVAGTTASYAVSSYGTPFITPEFSFNTSVSTPIAFATEANGVVDVLDAANALTLTRFDNTGNIVSQTSRMNPYMTSYFGAAIDKGNSFVYLAYPYNVIQATGDFSFKVLYKKGAINQYDFQGNLLRIFFLPGRSDISTTCYTPSNLSVDDQGSLWVADPTCHHLLSYSSQGVQLKDVSSAFPGYPRGMWTGPNENVFIAESVCDINGCPHGALLRLDSSGVQQNYLITSATVGSSWDSRIQYLAPPGDSQLQRFVLNNEPSAPVISSPMGTVAQHSANASLSWQSANDADGDPLVYSVYLGKTPGSLTFAGNTSQTSFTSAALAFGTAYFWQVTAQDSYLGLPIQTATSPVAGFNLNFTNNPPGGFGVSGGAGTLVTRNTSDTLAWQTSVDPDGDPIVYSVAWRPASQATATIFTTANTSLQMTGLSFGTSYYWSVQAQDPYGAATAMAGGTQVYSPIFENMPPSAVVYASTATSYGIHAASPTIDVSWLPSPDPDGDPVSYQLDVQTSTGSWPSLALGSATDFPLGVQFETTYYYRVEASDPYGGVSTGAWTSLIAHLANRAPNPIVYTAPNAVTTRAASYTLTWQATGDPDGDGVTYGIYLSTDPASQPLVQQGAQTSYSLALQFGTTAYWRVSATDSFGARTDGPLRSFLPTFRNSPPPAPPAMAGTGVMTSHTLTQIQLAWSAVQDPDGDPVSYQLALGLSSSSLSLMQTGAPTSYTLQNAAFGTTYYWQASAIDPYGAASTGPGQSLLLAFQNNPPGPFSALAGTGVLSTREASQTLAWSASTDPDGDAVTYTLSLSTVPGAATVVQQSTATSYALSFQIGTTYYWNVAAFDAFGGTTTISGGTQSFLGVLKNSPPTVPANQSKTGTIPYHGFSPSQSFFWQASTDPEGDPFTYSLYYGTDSSHLAVVSPVPLGFTLSSLNLNAAYFYRIVATDIYGASSDSPLNWVFYQFSDNPPGPFDVLGATGTVSTRDTSANLTWTPSADPDGDLVTYRVYIGTSNAALTPLLDTTKTSTVLPNLAFATTYYWRVDAYDAFGATTTANEGTQSQIRLFANTAPPAPAVTAGTGISLLHALAPQAHLSWSSVQDPEGDLVSYRLAIGVSSSSLSWVQLSSPTAYDLAAPHFGTTYYWQISAADPFGATSTSPLQSLLLVFQNNPPAPFTVLTGTGTLATRTTSELLSWGNSVDSDGDGVTYALSLSTTPGSLGVVQFSSATSYALGFQIGTTYYWNVSAFDGFGGTTTIGGGTQSFLPVFLNQAPQVVQFMSPFSGSPTITTMRDMVTVSWTQVTTPQNDPVTYTVSLGDSANGIQPVAQIGQAAQAGATALSVRPMSAKPQAQAVIDGNTITLTLTGLDYYRTYYLQVQAMNPYGAMSQTPIQTFTLSSSNGFPRAYNYPNPFSSARGGTNIVFNAPPSGYSRATVTVYSELGDLLFKQDYTGIAPGISQVPFPGRDRYGRPLFNGSYVCRVRFEGPDDRATFYLLVVK